MSGSATDATPAAVKRDSSRSRSATSAGAGAKRKHAGAAVTGPVKSRAWSTSLTAVQDNAPSGPAYADNVANPFSGTHFGAPRSAAVSVEITLR